MDTRLNAWTRRHLVLWYVLFFLASASLYTLAAYFPIYERWIIRPTVLDLALPLVPAAVPVYLTYFFFVPVALWMHRSHAGVAGVCRTIILCTGTHLLFVNLIPTEIAAYDWGHEKYALTRLLLQHDTRGAAFPSGHVALPFALAMVMRPDLLKGRVLYLVWGTVVAVSTLLTKQHYLQDVIVGWAWGTAAGLFGQRWIESDANAR